MLHVLYIDFYQSVSLCYDKDDNNNNSIGYLFNKKSSSGVSSGALDLYPLLQLLLAIDRGLISTAISGTP